MRRPESIGAGIFGTINPNGLSVPVGLDDRHDRVDQVLHLVGTDDRCARARLVDAGGHDDEQVQVGHDFDQLATEPERVVGGDTAGGFHPPEVAVVCRIERRAGRAAVVGKRLAGWPVVA